MNVHLYENQKDDSNRKKLCLIDVCIVSFFLSVFSFEIHNHSKSVEGQDHENWKFIKTRLTDCSFSFSPNSVKKSILLTTFWITWKCHNENRCKVENSVSSKKVTFSIFQQKFLLKPNSPKCQYPHNVKSITSIFQHYDTKIKT